MKAKQVMNLLLQGKKLTSKKWRDNSYITLNKEGDIIYIEEGVEQRLNGPIILDFGVNYEEYIDKPKSSYSDVCEHCKMRGREGMLVIYI